MTLMNKTIIKLLTVVALLAGTVSCIKDTTTFNYMKGHISFDIDEYIYTGDVVKLTAGGITTPEAPAYGWVITKIHTDTLYSNPIVVRFPDEPATYTVKALAWHKDYIVESVRKNVVTVDTTLMTGSLQGLPYASQKVYTDPRDGRSYRWEHIGSLDWFAENLAWEGAGYVYASSDVMNHVFGRHYTWEEATGGDICPEGWRLPDNTAWNDLGSALCGGSVSFDSDWAGAASIITPDAYFNGERFWPFSVNNTHDVKYNLNPLPCGFMQTADGGFYGRGTYGMWWSATAYDAANAYYRYIYWDSADFKPGYTSKEHIALSVRCVR